MTSLKRSDVRANCARFSPASAVLYATFFFLVGTVAEGRIIMRKTRELTDAGSPSSLSSSSSSSSSSVPFDKDSSIELDAWLEQNPILRTLDMFRAVDVGDEAAGGSNMSQAVFQLPRPEDDNFHWQYRAVNRSLFAFTDQPDVESPEPATERDLLPRRRSRPVTRGAVTFTPAPTWAPASTSAPSSTWTTTSATSLPPPQPPPALQRMSIDMRPTKENIAVEASTVTSLPFEVTESLEAALAAAAAAAENPALQNQQQQQPQLLLPQRPRAKVLWSTTEVAPNWPDQGGRSSQQSMTTEEPSSPFAPFFRIPDDLTIDNELMLNKLLDEQLGAAVATPLRQKATATLPDDDDDSDSDRSGEVAQRPLAQQPPWSPPSPRTPPPALLPFRRETKNPLSLSSGKLPNPLPLSPPSGELPAAFWERRVLASVEESSSTLRPPPPVTKRGLGTLPVRVTAAATGAPHVKHRPSHSRRPAHPTKATPADGRESFDYASSLDGDNTETWSGWNELWGTPDSRDTLVLFNAVDAATTTRKPPPSSRANRIDSEDSMGRSGRGGGGGGGGSGSKNQNQNQNPKRARVRNSSAFSGGDSAAAPDDYVVEDVEDQPRSPESVVFRIAGTNYYEDNRVSDEFLLGRRKKQEGRTGIARPPPRQKRRRGRGRGKATPLGSVPEFDDKRFALENEVSQARLLTRARDSSRDLHRNARIKPREYASQKAVDLKLFAPLSEAHLVSVGDGRTVEQRTSIVAGQKVTVDVANPLLYGVDLMTSPGALIHDDLRSRTPPYPRWSPNTSGEGAGANFGANSRRPSGAAARNVAAAAAPARRAHYDAPKQAQQKTTKRNRHRAAPAEAAAVTTTTRAPSQPARPAGSRDATALRAGSRNSTASRRHSGATPGADAHRLLLSSTTHEDAMSIAGVEPIQIESYDASFSEKLQPCCDDDGDSVSLNKLDTPSLHTGTGMYSQVNERALASSGVVAHEPTAEERAGMRACFRARANCYLIDASPLERRIGLNAFECLRFCASVAGCRSASYASALAICDVFATRNGTGAATLVRLLGYSYYEPRSTKPAKCLSSSRVSAKSAKLRVVDDVTRQHHVSSEVLHIVNDRDAARDARARLNITLATKSQCDFGKEPLFLRSRGVRDVGARNLDTVLHINEDDCVFSCMMNLAGYTSPFACMTAQYDAFAEACTLAGDAAEDARLVEGGDGAQINFYEKICVHATASARCSGGTVDRRRQRVLVGLVRDTVTVSSPVDCITACVDAAGQLPYRCRSVAYYYGERTRNCALSDSSAASHPRSLADEHGVVVDYFGVDECHGIREIRNGASREDTTNIRLHAPRKSSKIRKTISRDVRAPVRRLPLHESHRTR